MMRSKDLNINKPKYQKLFSSELLAVSALSVLSVFGFARITNKLINNDLKPFRTDIKVMRFLNSLQTPALTKTMKVITSLASLQILPFIAGAATFAFFKSKHSKPKSFDIPVIAIGSEILNLLFKAKYKRVRPAQNELKVSGWSYPSGHAMESISFYGLLVYSLLKSKKFPKGIVLTGSALLSVLILLIGVSRSYLKVHYPSDVVAGYAVGLLWLVSSITIIRNGEKIFRKQQSEICDISPYYF